MAIDYVALGARIRKERKRRHMSQERLAELADLSPPHISCIECGHKPPSLDAAARIAAAMGMSASALLQGCERYPADADTLLDDCSDAELRAILSIAEAVKAAIRS